MKKRLAIMVAGIILAFIVSLVDRPGAYEYYRFKTGNFPEGRETAQIRNAIKWFSALTAGFYATGGVTPTGLNTFPADNPVKRRIFQDIQNWLNAKEMLVMDRDKSTVKQILFTSPDKAIVVVDEDWFSVHRDSVTRRRLSEKRANLITVRYFLKKRWGNWVVVEYEVYEQKESLPPLPSERLAIWQRS